MEGSNSNMQYEENKMSSWADLADSDEDSEEERHPPPMTKAASYTQLPQPLILFMRMKETEDTEEVGIIMGDVVEGEGNMEVDIEVQIIEGEEIIGDIGEGEIIEGRRPKLQG